MSGHMSLGYRQGCMSQARRPSPPCIRRRRFLIRRTRGGGKGREEEEIDSFLVLNGGREARDLK